MDRDHHIIQGMRYYVLSVDDRVIIELGHDASYLLMVFYVPVRENGCYLKALLGKSETLLIDLAQELYYRDFLFLQALTDEVLGLYVDIIID